MIERANGPECPACGCTDAEILREPDEEASWWHGSGLARCNHCGKRFGFSEYPPAIALPPPPPPPAEVRQALGGAVLYNPICCPACHSENTRITSTRPRKNPSTPQIRYHRCNDCDHRFKSIQSRRDPAA